MSFQIYFDEESDEQSHPMIIQEMTYSNYAVNDNRLPKDLLIKKIFKGAFIILIIALLFYIFSIS